MAETLNIGLVGYGFMGRTHSNAYRQVNQFFDVAYRPVLKAVCGRKEDSVRAFADTWGWESCETDWRTLIERDDIDVIDICSPNNTHHDIAIAAAQAGKTVLCEKPLAMNADEGREMVAAVEQAGVPNMVSFNYRRVPAIALAHQLVGEQRVGRVFHYRATYLQDWTISPKVPQGGATFWRLDIDAAGSGVTGDLLAHSIDTAMWLNGPIESVTAMTETFVKEREVQDRPGEISPVGIDDACAFLVRFANGSMGTFESTRYARGRKNYNTFEMMTATWTDGGPYWSPTPTTRTWTGGGCPAASSATSTPSSTPWPTSSRACSPARPYSLTSAAHSTRRSSATPCWSRHGADSGSRSARRDPVAQRGGSSQAATGGQR